MCAVLGGVVSFFVLELLLRACSSRLGHSHSHSVRHTYVQPSHRASLAILIGLLAYMSVCVCVCARGVLEAFKSLRLSLIYSVSIDRFPCLKHGKMTLLHTQTQWPSYALGPSLPHTPHPLSTHTVTLHIHAPILRNLVPKSVRMQMTFLTLALL